MSKTEWPDESIKKAICSAMQDERNQALKFLYLQHRSRVIEYVKIHGGTEEDGEDVLQDTLLLFDRNLRENRFEGNSSLSTYFIAIAKWRWTTLKRRQMNKMKDINWQNKQVQEEENYEIRMISEERRMVIDQLLTKLGRKCKEILRMASLSFSMEEIAQNLMISSALQARQDAYKCRLRFKEMVVENPDLLTTLKSWLHG
jgi:RNA polymerase sigma factor (sigma-70 family)